MPDCELTREITPVLKGAVTSLPGVGSLLDWSRRARHGVAYWGGDASYSYGIWLKHIALLDAAGMTFPDAIAEFGPGDSLGVGIAALLSGVKTYGAFDARPFANALSHERLTEQLVELLRTRAPRPTKGWPDFDHLAQPALFPSLALADSRLQASLAANNVTSVSQAVESWSANSADRLHYLAPWTPQSLPVQRYDLILSHSVLEYVQDMAAFFRICAGMLRPGGWMSHQVDMTSLGITRAWNGHLAYPDWVWRIVLGGRAWGPNRLLARSYLAALDESGFELIWSSRRAGVGGLKRDSHTAVYRDASHAELVCDGLFIIARLRER